MSTGSNDADSSARPPSVGGSSLGGGSAGAASPGLVDALPVPGETIGVPAEAQAMENTPPPAQPVSGIDGVAAPGGSVASGPAGLDGHVEDGASPNSTGTSVPASGDGLLDVVSSPGNTVLATGVVATADSGESSSESRPVKKKPMPRPRGKAKAQGGPTTSPPSPSVGSKGDQPASESSDSTKHDDGLTSDTAAGIPTSPSTPVTNQAAPSSSPTITSKSPLNEEPAGSKSLAIDAGRTPSSPAGRTAPELTLKLPGWMVDPVAHLRKVSDDGAWQSLVDIWIRFEILVESPAGVVSLLWSLICCELTVL